jgi:hypothetical protein
MQHCERSSSIPMLIACSALFLDLVYMYLYVQSQAVQALKRKKGNNLMTADLSEVLTEGKLYYYIVQSDTPSCNGHICNAINCSNMLICSAAVRYSLELIVFCIYIALTVIHGVNDLRGLTLLSTQVQLLYV